MKLACRRQGAGFSARTFDLTGAAMIDEVVFVVVASAQPSASRALLIDSKRISRRLRGTARLADARSPPMSNTAHRSATIGCAAPGSCLP